MSRNIISKQKHTFTMQLFASGQVGLEQEGAGVGLPYRKTMLMMKYSV
jgi:hypothetical protein